MRHLTEAGEHYVEHGLFALRIAFYLFLAACAAVIHAVLPCVFETTASDAVKHLADVLDRRGHKS